MNASPAKSSPTLWTTRRPISSPAMKQAMWSGLRSYGLNFTRTRCSGVGPSTARTGSTITTSLENNRTHTNGLVQARGRTRSLTRPRLLRCRGSNPPAPASEPEYHEQQRHRSHQVHVAGREHRDGEPHCPRCVAARADGRPPGGLPSHVCLNVPFRFPSCAKWHPEATSWRTRSCVK